MGNRSKLAGRAATRRQFLLGVAGTAAAVTACGTEGEAEPKQDEGSGGSGTDSGGGGSSSAGAGGATESGGAENAAGGSAADAGTGGSIPAAGGATTADGGPLTDAAPTCVSTSGDIEGPFYLPGIPRRSELDLYGEPGDKLTLSGVVLDASCAPIRQAIVELWGADTQGAYDTTTEERRYYGQVATSEDGSYGFHTVLPARYLNGAQYRPRHLHLKVWLPAKGADGGPALTLALTTQIYFEGDPYNEIDAWWSPDRTIALAERSAGELEGTFGVVLGGS